MKSEGWEWRVVRADAVGPLNTANDPDKADVAQKIRDGAIGEIVCCAGQRDQPTATVWLRDAAICADIEFESLDSMRNYLGQLRF